MLPIAVLAAFLALLDLDLQHLVTGDGFRVSHLFSCVQCRHWNPVVK